MGFAPATPCKPSCGGSRLVRRGQEGWWHLVWGHKRG